jgi:tetratricopeptide (TPR) repeat protein
MIKIDILNAFDRIQDRWETKGGLIVSICLFVISWILFYDHFLSDKFGSYWWIFLLMVPIAISIIVILTWLFSTNRFFLKGSDRIIAGICIIIDNDKDKPVISKIIRKVVHHVNNSKVFPNVQLRILPTNQLKTVKEVERYHMNFNFMYDLIIRIFVVSGQYDSIEKIIVEQLSVTFKPKSNEKEKRIYFNTVDLAKDMSLQVASRNWEYLITNSGIDNRKYFENILAIVMYYIGFYAIYDDRFEDALEIMSPIYNAKNTIVPISKIEGNEITVKLRPFNIAEGRLAAILVDLFFYTAILTYQKSETAKALEYFQRLEQILKAHPQKFNQYINMARFSYEVGNLKEAIEYTNKARKINANSVMIFLNLGFFAIIEDNKQEFCNNYFEIFKRRSNTDINWVDVLDFQIKQQGILTDRNMYFQFSIAFIEFLFLQQIIKNDFLKIVNEFETNADYNCIYELGQKILGFENTNKNPNAKMRSTIRKKRKRKRK